MRFAWRMVVGSIIGFLGASLGSIGGGGGGGIFVPMLTFIVEFDTKSAASLSKCMATGAAISTVYFNLKRRHPTLDMPVTDYHLALLIQPMLLLGISIGIALRKIVPEWITTILLLIVFIGPLTMALSKGLETWKKETMMKKHTGKCLEFGNVSEEVENESVPSNPPSATLKKTNSVVPVHENEYLDSEEVEDKSVENCQRNVIQKDKNGSRKAEASILENVYWKELGLLTLIWIVFFLLQIAKNEKATCSISYWVLSSIQIPVSIGGSLYQAVSLYKGNKVIASMGEAGTKLEVHQLILYCFIGILAGSAGELLRIGAGFILVPFFLQLGIPPQVASATATFVTLFSASMSVIEYYLLRHFPLSYALYFLAVAAVAAFVGQHAGRKMVMVFRRTSLIVFVLVFTIFVSAMLLGGIGIENMIKKIERHDYLGFHNFCLV